MTVEGIKIILFASFS